MCIALQGDPSAAPYAVDNAKAILGQKPVFGICMGHQVLGQAFGGKTFKLKFGHHGGNHPIRYVPTGELLLGHCSCHQQNMLSKYRGLHRWLNSRA